MRIFSVALLLFAVTISARAANETKLVAAYCCDNGYVADVYRGAEKLRSLPLGHHPTDVAVTPDGKLLVIPQFTENTVLITDAQTGKLIRTVDVGSGTTRVVISSDGKTAYLPTFSNATNNVTAIDLSTFTTRVSAPLTGSSGRPAVALSPDGSRLFYLATALYELDTATLGVLAQATPGSNYYTLAVTPDGSEIYVNGAYAHALLILATSDFHIISQIVFSGVFIAFNHDGSRFYAANGATLEEHDTATLALLRQTGNSLNANLTGLALSADGNTLYAPIQYGPSLLEFDVATWTQSAAAPVCSTLSSVSIDAAENSAIAVNGVTCAAAIVDTTTEALQSSVELGQSQPYYLTLSEATGSLQVYTSSSKPTIGVANVATHNSSVISLKAPVLGIAVSPDGRNLYAALTGSYPAIAVVDTSSNTVTSTVPLPGPKVPLTGNVATSPDGLHVAAMFQLSPPNTFDSYSFVYLIDPSTSKVLKVLSLLGLSFQYSDLSFTADSKYLYVPGYKTVIEIDVDHFKVSRVLPLSYSPQWVSVAPDGSAAFAVGNASPATVSRIDLATGQVTARQVLSEYGLGKPLITADSQHIYLPSQATAIRILDPFTLAVVGSLPVTQTTALAFLP